VEMASCNEQVTVYSDTNCTLDPIVLVAQPACTTNEARSGRVDIAPSGTCLPSGGAIVGVAVPAMPTTICCAP
jgi:hypothetical protein